MEEVIIVGVCLILNALFAAYEMAFVSVPKPELRALARKGNKDAKTLLTLRDSPERTLSIIQIGITLVGAIAAAVGGAGASEVLEPYFIQRFGMREIIAETLSVVLVVLPITYLSVVVGELVPKTLALRNPAKIVLAGAKWLFILDRVFAPLVHTLEWSTRMILNIFFRKSKTSVKHVETAIEIDTFSPVHQTFMLNLAQIEKIRISDIMLPWSQVVSVKSTDSIEEVVQTILSSGHTRLPVTLEGRVLGLLHSKEFMALKESGEKNWLPLIRRVILVRPTDSAFGVMRILQGNKNHMTMVLSQTGEMLGIVTLEDILEEIVGDIFDEDDDDRVRKVYAAKIKARVVRREPDK